jgi:hypothetical protein
LHFYNTDFPNGSFLGLTVVFWLIQAREETGNIVQVFMPALPLIGFAGHEYLLIYDGCHSSSVVQALSAGWFIEKKKGCLKRMRTDFKRLFIVYENKTEYFKSSFLIRKKYKSLSTVIFEYF